MNTYDKISYEVYEETFYHIKSQSDMGYVKFLSIRQAQTRTRWNKLPVNQQEHEICLSLTKRVMNWVI